ncbi:trehalose utilization [Salipaludibacillus neizhouensis]|uniref:Trehalose utilization n=1 Tax=Salipaludibacillus neizhouensis TaxID=885475 RepID=A0A3A9K9A1_9BACI|nr:ThuA domain-containing protein [Salipaludibacillus neizhouensis]RKL67400.1 trehalose utilization [Salipaludibacillus neizhouensis]
MSLKITAVLGDYYHNEKVSFKASENTVQMLNEEIGGVEIKYISPNELIEDLNKKPDVVILFKENRLNPEDDIVTIWMDKDTASAITKYVENGGGWIAWHSGMAKYENVTEYISMLRGQFKYHGAHQIVEYIAEPGSDFIVKDNTFKFLDEHYMVDCEEENTNVLLRSRSVDGDSIAAWAHEYGNGRVMCIAPAHLEEGLLHPAFQKMMVNSLKWCARKISS